MQLITITKKISLLFFKKPSIESYIDEIDIYITEDYLNGTFNSCKNVQVPSTGQLAFDLMCGSWGASKCTPQRWFHFMGDAKNNLYVPFQINYLPQKSTDIVNNMKPLNPKIVPCSESIDVSV